MMELNSEDVAFKKIFGIEPSMHLNSEDVATYFPEFRNHHGNRLMKVEMYTKGNPMVELI